MDLAIVDLVNVELENLGLAAVYLSTIDQVDIAFVGETNMILKLEALADNSRIDVSLIH